MDMTRCESCGKHTKEHLHLVDSVLVCHECNMRSVSDMLFSLMEAEPDLLRSIGFRKYGV